MHKSLSKEDRNNDNLRYARVSTNGQDLGSQEAELMAAGAAKVFKEKISGAKTVHHGESDARAASKHPGSPRRSEPLKSTHRYGSCIAAALCSLNHMPSQPLPDQPRQKPPPCEGHRSQD